VTERPLTSSEVKQIAGRAGRYGLYDVGYVTTYYDYEMIERLLFHKLIPLSKAMINIPEEFLEKDGKISTILEMWNRVPAAEYYDKGDIAEKIKVARALEEICDNRELIRKYIRIPANPDNKETFAIYTDFYKALCKDMPANTRAVILQYSADNVNATSKQALQTLETCSAVFDFLYSFTRMFGEEEDLWNILEIKREISEKIFEILDMQKLSMKSCIICGRKLKWSYSYTICQECYRKKHRPSLEGLTKGHGE
jgi:ATP-dependent RNA helicase SUPV3L1/SUV3